MSLSLCMIVKDEAENLPSCLNSVTAMVDEMVVLDTGSTDETVAIAQSLGAQVHHFSWCDDFSAARNAALQYVTSDWVLVLDADERLEPGIVPQLEQVMQLETCLVVNLVRYEVGAAQSPYSLVSRLFRRHPKLQFSRPYHAMVDDSVAAILLHEPQWQVVELPDVAILHEGYQAGAIASRDKLQKARLTMERFLVKHPGDPYVCSKLGALYVQINQTSYGIELLERGLKSTQADPPICYELHYHLGIAYSRLQHLDQAAMHYQLAIQQPILPRLKLGAYNNLGNLRKATGDLTGAKAIYEQALRVDPSFAMGHYNLGMALKAMGQLGEAIAHYQQAIQLNPNYAEAYQNLGVTLLKLGKVAESLAAFERAIALHQQHDPTEAQRLRQGLQEMGFQV
ncbi:MAG: tetratricopeptide repeat protein [Leptolyngbyaceae cyanobacterium SL_5_9]|nr:tetratricopeptide repeat protein [Leptolyngbyaceae cyanobacterium SL_5_9]NJO75655.1 tetratricopeptide repeat protein [Leptolyngbyaceae cyanobacterium RM1_406_9]